MDFASIIVSLVSVGMSGFAIFKAKSAYKMAQTVIGRKNEQEDGQRLRDLIAILTTAKQESSQNVGAQHARRSAGRSNQQSHQRVREAEDALRTKLPISWNDEQRFVTSAAADDIEIALKTINSKSKIREGWRHALSTLQTILPHLEQEERKLRDRALLPIKF